MSDRLEIVPLTRSQAQDFIRDFHRHHRPSVSDIFRMGLEQEGELVGCAMVGRPVARALCDGHTVEITRLCVREDVPNGASKLLGACRRAAWALGYRRLITYTLKSEGGSSLRAAGYSLVGERPDRHWNAPSRPRVERKTGQKYLWEQRR